MKKLLTVTLVMVMVLGLMGGVAGANECVRYGQGYWKQWLAENDDYVCPSGLFTAGDLLEMLNTPARGDANQILVYQFIAAALNADPVSNGCTMPPAVEAAFGAAYNHLIYEAGDSGATRDDILYWKDILEFWNQNKYAELELVEYYGICNVFGSHAGDTLTLTFSNDIYLDGAALKMYFRDAQPNYIDDVPVADWTINGNMLTVTANWTFITPRPEIGDYVLALDGFVDKIGNDVVVPTNGVEVEGEMSYDMIGTWELSANRLIVIDYQDNGSFNGEMTEADGTGLGNISGTVDGDDIIMRYDRVGYVTGGYYVDFTGIMTSCNSASGTYVHGDDSGPRDGVFDWSITRQ